VANRTDAKRCLEHAAKAGIPEGQYRLAVLLLESAPGDRTQRTEAALLLNSSASALPESVFLLALLNAEQGTDPPAQRDRVIQTAAESGYAPAQYQLAQRLLSNNTPDSRTAAVKWLESAATQQHADASVELAMLLEKDRREQDIPRIVMLLEQAARAGSVRADYALGIRYLDANGVKRDSERAVELFRRSAMAGYLPSQYALGFVLSHGIGVANDDVASLEWFRRAADRGNPAAMHAVGNAYANGWGVGKSIDIAYKWYCRAAQGGDSSARDLVQRRPAAECPLADAQAPTADIARPPLAPSSGERAKRPRD